MALVEGLLQGLLHGSQSSIDKEITQRACEAIHDAIDNNLAPKSSTQRSLVLCAETALQV
jgi:hypothetical protein